MEDSTFNAAGMADALTRLWAKFLPEIERRVAVLEAAALALADGSLSNEQREAALAAAHKLAGTLGTFGLRRGTEVARMAEVRLSSGISVADAPELSAWTAELRSILREQES